MNSSNDAIRIQLRDLVRELPSRTPIEQAIVAVEAGGEAFRWVGAYEKSDSSGKALSEETPFFLASIDKLYNATIAMKLSEAGRLDLDEPITTYLPPEVVRGLHRFDGIDYSESLTVRHLLTHTSGLADWLEDAPRQGTSLVNQVVEQGDREFTMEELAAWVRDRLRPHFPPQDFSTSRQKARYSDTNFMLVIQIIEAVTQQPLHQVHREMLFEPLCMRQTYFPGSSWPLDPTPEPITLRVNGQPIRIPLFIRSIRGIYGSIADSMKFMRQLVDGTVFQNHGTLLEMQKNWRGFDFPRDRAALRSPSWPVEYGIGIMRFQLPRIFTSMRLLPAVIGHTGSTGCWLLYCPEWDTLVSGSVDEVTAGALPYRTVPKILSIVRAAEWATTYKSGEASI
jgi:D-alanyl-D-alanine carboxypeptidase